MEDKKNARCMNRRGQWRASRRAELPSIFIVIYWAFQRFCSDSSAAVVALLVAQQGVSSPGIRCSELDVGLLMQVPLEQAIVKGTGLYLFSPYVTIRAIGVFEIGLGFWLVSGLREKLACAVTSGFLIILMMLAVIEEPMLLVGPFGGMAKNSALLVLAWIVWRIASLKHD